MSKKKITKLTQAQTDKLKVYKDTWLAYGLSTLPADREKAEAGVKLAYELAGLEAPKYFVWLDSPYQGAVGAAMLKNMGEDQVRDQVRDQVGAQVWDQVGAQVRDQVRDQVWAQVRDQVGAQVRDQVGAQVWAAGYGQHDAGWLSFYDYFLNETTVENIEKIEGLLEISKNAGWWWPFKNLCILTERPNFIARDERDRLHCEHRAAIEYRDGWSVYAWHGVRIPEEWIKDKKSLTPQIALTWSNIEQRRAACEILGWNNILKELKAKVIDKDPNPQIGELLEVELPDIGTERFLRVQCGTGREFALPVTLFEHRTAKECNAATYGWQKGLPIEDFIPTHRT